MKIRGHLHWRCKDKESEEAVRKVGNNPLKTSVPQEPEKTELQGQGSLVL